jgi:beta-glucosidase-like glycosyl hydrolase/CubicO group peptidase (beta-lactamase class C family)
MDNAQLVYEMGVAVGDQCKRIGIHVNYAPVVDINNNPNNPVIGFRSFGEDKNKVAKFGIAYMKGMQDAGIMACAKHFPGHGDVDVDSHLDLPVINKTKEQLDTNELMPFKEIFKAGIGSVMIAHLYIPAYDTAANRASSISKNTVNGILRNEIGFQGLTFTDALEMKGVAKYFPDGVISVEALIAGNDMLCLPASVSDAIDQIKKAIEEKRLSWEDIDTKVKKVLMAKYKLGLNQMNPIDTTNLLNDLNAKTDAIRNKIAKQTLTVLTQAGVNDKAQIPLSPGKKIAYVGIGSSTLNEFGKRISEEYKADTYLFSWTDGDSKADSIFETFSQKKYDAIVLGIHNFSNRPANNYGITNASFALWRKLNTANSVTFVFGNVLASARYCNANALVACYQDDDITQKNADDLLEGNIGASGKLPVRVCNFSAGYGINIKGPEAYQARSKYNLHAVDSIAEDAVLKKAFPGCVVFAAKDGEIIFHKAFGNTTFENQQPESIEKIFDLASVTKISATTISVMKLYEQGKLNLKKNLGDYLPSVRGTDKAHLLIEDVLLHQAGLVPFIPFYKETIDTVTGIPLPGFYSDKEKPGYTVRVAQNLYMRNDWQDTIYKRILQSPVTRRGHYVYSDNDFIFLGKIVEAITGMTLDQYVQKTFYSKMGLETTGFKPRNRFAVSRIVPTETEKHFRQQTMQGDVHDEGASMFGGVAGHAGLFSDAYDLAMLYQMLLNGGEMNGERFLQEKTIKYFTAYHSEGSRRGFGFDKPEKDNATRKEPYPSALASLETFGHTGYTGTCVWVDPKYNLVYIFLSNRVNPTRNNNKISQMLVRGKIQDAIIEAVK